MFTLKSISKRNQSFVYHIEVKVSDETFYVEMRKQKLTTNSIYLACTSTKCNAKVILTVTGIPIVKISKFVYKFGANTTDEMMLQTNNYGEIFHNHRNCQDMRTDGTCRTIRHETACFKKRCQDTKRNYREEVKKVLKQNPSSKNKEIPQIVNTNEPETCSSITRTR